MNVGWYETLAAQKTGAKIVCGKYLIRDSPPPLHPWLKEYMWLPFRRCGSFSVWILDISAKFRKQHKRIDMYGHRGMCMNFVFGLWKKTWFLIFYQFTNRQKCLFSLTKTSKKKVLYKWWYGLDQPTASSDYHIAQLAAGPRAKKNTSIVGVSVASTHGYAVVVFGWGQVCIAM